MICPFMCSITENSQTFVNLQTKLLAGAGKLGTLVEPDSDGPLCFAPEFSASFIGYRFLKISALVGL